MSLPDTDCQRLSTQCARFGGKLSAELIVYNPIPAYDGKAGLQKIGDSNPDLIILDVMMPEKSGFVLFNLAVWSLVAQVWRTLTRCANAGGSNRGLARG